MIAGVGIVLLAAIVVWTVYRTPNRIDNLSTGTFGGVSLRIELATTTAVRERGLSGRTTVPDDYGMLFVFSTSQRHGFWMKDMHVPIDIFWLDESMRVVSFMSNVATSTYPSVFYPASPARYVLETASGFADTKRIATGTPLLLQKLPTVSE